MNESAEQIRTILDAALFSAQRHSTQRRKGAAVQPYINHLIEVAQLVSTALTEADTTVLAGALLHDVLEDTTTTKDELEKRFGLVVANLVSELTDDKSLPKEERKRLQIENAPKKSQRAGMIKIADKISNLRAIISSPRADWSDDRKKEYFEWAKRVVDGLTEPNSILKAQFDALVRDFLGLQ